MKGKTMSVNKSQRARGGNRGGTGGGYERTDENWDSTRINRLRAEYDTLDDHWKASYLKGLSKWDRILITDREPR